MCCCIQIGKVYSLKEKEMLILGSFMGSLWFTILVATAGLVCGIWLRPRVSKFLNK